ncbi:MAG: DUF4037 domain-containing protein [Chitinispirillaceae bacterium]|nr:DUF4037 domain-containing protein [Chitinispirillaceae bacterium]
MKGLELSKRYYHDCIKSIIEKDIPEISQKYAAGLIGPCSEVLGNDDEFSRDYMWGPRCYLFLGDVDHEKYALSVDTALNHELPPDFLGCPTRFEMSGNGGMPSKSGTGFHQVCITTPERFIELSLGIKALPASDFQWLFLSEQRLLELVRGEIFDDFTGEISHLRQSFAYFPDNVWKYRIAYNLESLGWEDDLIYLCGVRDDRISMNVNACKTVEKLMRLVFLLNKRYAPLSPKWLQREFRKLPEIAPQIEGELLCILEAEDYHDKVDALNFIYETILTWMKSEDLCDSYARQIRVNVSGVRIDIQKSAKDVFRSISGELAQKAIGGIPIGAVDQWMINEDFIMSADHMNSFTSVYNPERTERNRPGDLFIVPPL